MIRAARLIYCHVAIPFGEKKGDALSAFSDCFPSVPRMVNTDKVKAARTGGGLKYHAKVTAIHTASRVAHANEERLNGIHQELRKYEDAGYGVATGRQFEHEQRMREQKAKREAKAAKSAAFLASLQADVDVSEDDASPTQAASSSTSPATIAVPSLRYGVGDRVRCCIGPRQWAAGSITRLHYREDNWPAGRTVPYQVMLDDGERIFAPADVDDVIRAALDGQHRGEAGPSSSSTQRHVAREADTISGHEVRSRHPIVVASYYY